MVAGAACAGALVGIPWYLGAFRSIKFTETRTEPSIFLFIKHVGPYKDTGSIFAKLIPLQPTLGLHIMAMMPMDSPQHVEAAKLRSMVGLLLPASRASEVEGILKKISESGLTMSVREIKAARAKHTFFPLRSSLSFMLGPIKVYSAAYTGLDALPCGSVEVYHTQQIEFIFAMENPEDYSWPESWTEIQKCWEALNKTQRHLDLPRNCRELGFSSMPHGGVAKRQFCCQTDAG